MAIDLDGVRDRLSDWRALATPGEVVLQRTETFRDGARLFEGFDDVAHEDAQTGPYVGVVEVPRRQLGVDAIIGVAQRIKRSGGKHEQRGCMDADGQVDR